MARRRTACSELEQEQDSEEEADDLSPLLKAAVDNLWQRPYDCRVFTVQLLQALSELDDKSVCMMSRSQIPQRVMRCTHMQRNGVEASQPLPDAR